MVVGSSPRSMTSLALGSWIDFQYQARFSQEQLGLQFNYIATDYCQDMHASITPSIVQCWSLLRFATVKVLYDYWMLPSSFDGDFWYYKRYTSGRRH